MASSPYALRESLRRIRGKIADRLAGQSLLQSTGEADGDWTDWEELSEREC